MKPNTLKKWTKDEDELMKLWIQENPLRHGYKHHSSIAIAGLQSLFPDRTPSSIKEKLNRLKKPRVCPSVPKSKRRWTDEHQRRLERVMSKYTGGSLRRYIINEGKPELPDYTYEAIRYHAKKIIAQKDHKSRQGRLPLLAAPVQDSSYGKIRSGMLESIEKVLMSFVDQRAKEITDARINELQEELLRCKSGIADYQSTIKQLKERLEILAPIEAAFQASRKIVVARLNENNTVVSGD